MRPMTFVFALGLAGCATAGAGAGESVPVNGTPTAVVNRPAPDLATQEKFDARAEAHRFDHAADCELSARQLKERNPDRGWKLLRACVDRGDFTELRALLDGPWDAELRGRGDAGELLTKLVAVRGGDIEGDLALLHEHKVPVFTLADALAQPEVYAGRLVILRARPGELRNRGGQATVELIEYTHNAEMVYAAVGPGRQRTRETTHTSRENGSSEHHHTMSTRRDTATEQRMVTEDVETGRQALGKLAKVDPFFEPDKDFVILARFDGVRQKDGDDEADKLAVLSVLHYFRPGALSLY